MSNINPQSIDGTYPIAGQDNNSQGFRDNFTNTVNNFTFAAAELTDLQQNALLKAPLGSIGQTSVSNDMNYATLIHPQIKGAVETAALNLTVDGSNNFTVNWASGHFQSVTITANSTFSFGTWPTANYFTKLRLQVTVSGGTYTLTFPTGVNINISNIQGYTTGTTVSLAAGVYVFEFSTVNFGANVVIQDVLRNYDSPIDFTNLVVSGYAAISGNVIGGLARFASINSTPIGNASPSTGAFTTLTATTLSSSGITNTGAQVETGYQQVKPTANVAVTVNSNVNRVLLHPTGTIVSFGANVTLPNTQVDGTIISISSNVTIAALAVITPWIGSTVSPYGNTASVAPGTVSRYMYIAADYIWYKIA